MSKGSDRTLGGRTWLRWGAIALAAVVAFGVGSLLRQIGSGGEGEADEASPASVEAKLPDRPAEAAREALAAAHSELSTERELMMIDVAADGSGLERVLDTGDRVSAALVLEANVVTAGSDGSVQVWGRLDGALLGATKIAAPLVALADTEASSPFLAGLDSRGKVWLVDVADPARPQVLPLGARLTSGEAPMAVAFSKDTLEVVAIGAGGEVLRIDQTTRELVSRSSLWDFRGSLPWGPDGPTDPLSAAKFVPGYYADEEGLLVATADGAVADLDLALGQGKTLLKPGLAPGRILDLDRKSYEVDLAVGASGGYLIKEQDEFDEEPEAWRGPPAPAIAVDPMEDLWRGESGGVEVPDLPGQPLSGPPVRGFDVSFHGVAALNAGNQVSVLGPAGVGLSMAETDTTPVASFEPNGHLLVAWGFDANHIEEVRAIRPQPRLVTEDYQLDDEVKTYKPDPEWWPAAEDPEALYLNDVAGDGELVVAAGQDPEGEAALMVWDADSGEPLQHLTLGTGGVSTELPNIATKVVLLPGRNEIAAYSAVQELIAIWSTETWELEDSIPVGPIGSISVSPDEAMLVTVGLGEDPEFDPEYNEPVDLRFVDLEEFELDHELQIRGALESAISPDGRILAIADEGGLLRFRSSDGRREEREPVEIGGSAAALAWRPDGEMLAVALDIGKIFLVDPESGAVSDPLPTESYGPSHSLSWNRDGSLLASLSAEPEEEGEGYDPGPAKIWTLDAAALERRMCELGGCEAPTPSESSPAGALGDASRLSGIDAVFGREGDLVATDREGNTARIGSFEEDYYPAAAYDWSGDGDLAWSSPGHVSVLIAGSKTPRSWPCACRGVAWNGKEVLSLKLDGSALVRINAISGAVSTSVVNGLPPFDPTLLGIVADQPIIAAYEREPDRSTFSDLYRIELDGTARLFGDAGGSIYRLWPSSSSSALVFVAGRSSGACYSTDDIGVIAAAPDGDIEVNVPPQPLGDEFAVVRSAQMAADSSLSAAISPLGCDDDGMIEDREPLAERYLFKDGRWSPTGARGFDVQSVAGGIAEVKRSDERSVPGALALVNDGGRLLLAPQIEGLVARP